jgi:hypothetical protein
MLRLNLNPFHPLLYGLEHLHAHRSWSGGEITNEAVFLTNDATDFETRKRYMMLDGGFESSTPESYRSL